MSDVNVTITEESINITINTIELINGAFVRQTFTGDGITTTFNLNSPARNNSIFVFLNGILQEENTDYTVEENRKSITFTVAPKGPSGNRDADKIEVRYVVE